MWIGVGAPAVSATVPQSCLAAWSLQSSTSFVPFTNRRTPSEDVVQKVNVSENGAFTTPSHLTEKPLAPARPGLATKSKLISASTREPTSELKSVPEKYSP